MRLWSIHPKYLDAKGLVVFSREALLAQGVLAGKTAIQVHPAIKVTKGEKAAWEKGG